MAFTRDELDTIGLKSAEGPLQGSFSAHLRFDQLDVVLDRITEVDPQVLGMAVLVAGEMWHLECLFTIEGFHEINNLQRWVMNLLQVNTLHGILDFARPA
jgi:hypothetical protein